MEFQVSKYWHSWQMCDLCPLPEECSVPWERLCRDHVPVDDMWPLKSFFFPLLHKFLVILLWIWRCPDTSLPVFWNKACWQPNQTWETSRFREVECQGSLTGLAGLFCRNEISSQDSFQAVCSSGLEDTCPSVYESQAGHQSPEMFEVLWSCKWRSVLLLSGTFLFAMVRPHRHCSHFCNPVPQGPGMDWSCVFISPFLMQNRAGGKVEDGWLWSPLLSFQHGRDA